MKRSLVAVGCLALTIAAACEKKDGAPAATAASDSTAVRAWRMEPDLRIPTATSAVDTALVSDVEPFPDTTLFALLPDERRIVVYDKFGNTRTEFGKEQLSAPASLGSYQGQIWVWEPSLGKLSRFKPDGAFVRSAELFQKSARGKTELGLEAVMNDSVLLVQTAASGDVVRVPRGALLLVRYDGSVLDTVALIRGQPAALTVGSPNAPQFRAPQPFADRTFVAFSPADGFVVIARADTATDRKTPVIRLTKVNLVGDTLFTRELPYTPKPFDAALAGPAVDRLVRDNRHNWLGVAPSLDDQKRLLRAALYTPKYVPAISGLMVATDGTILVGRADGTNEMVWLVLNRADAREIAQLRVPADLRALGAGGQYFFASGYGAAGNPELVRYRLLPD